MKNIYSLCAISLFLTSCNFTAPPTMEITKASLNGIPILKEYAKKFKECDDNNSFGGFKMVGNARCKSDPNALKGFEQLKGQAIKFTAKLSLDIDGGYAACEKPTLKTTNLCPTAFNYPGWGGKKSTEFIKKNWEKMFVNSDTVPYIVIPTFSINKKTVREVLVSKTQQITEGKEFSKNTGIVVGDVAVVLFKGKVIPVIVGDGGPFNKIGEGSLALFDKLGHSKCNKRLASNNKYCDDYQNNSLKSDEQVTTILFPNSRIEGLNPQNINAKVKEKAMRLYNNLLN